MHPPYFQYPAVVPVPVVSPGVHHHHHHHHDAAVASATAAMKLGNILPAHSLLLLQYQQNMMKRNMNNNSSPSSSSSASPSSPFLFDYPEFIPAGLTQNGPFGPRRSPFGPQQSPRHSGNNATPGIGRFPPFGFPQQRQQLRPGMKAGNAVYG